MLFGGEPWRVLPGPVKSEPVAGEYIVVRQSLLMHCFPREPLGTQRARNRICLATGC